MFKNLFLIRNKALFIFQNKDDEQTLKKYNVTKYSKTIIIEGSGVNTKKFTYYNSLIQKIQNTRKRNNKNWMDIMRIGFKYKPEETKKIVKKIFQDDQRINKLIKTLVK